VVERRYPPEANGEIYSQPGGAPEEVFDRIRLFLHRLISDVPLGRRRKTPAQIEKFLRAMGKRGFPSPYPLAH
jgi:hypothetical protein